MAGRTGGLRVNWISTGRQWAGHHHHRQKLSRQGSAGSQPGKQEKSEGQRTRDRRGRELRLAARPRLIYSAGGSRFRG